MTTLDLLHLRNSVAALAAASIRYAPKSSDFAQLRKIENEMEELSNAMHFQTQEETAIECADVVIAAVRLGAMLSDDFARVIADKCAELDLREPLA